MKCVEIHEYSCDSTLEVAPCEDNFVLPLGFRLCSYVYINTISLIWLVPAKISFLMQVQLAGKTDRPGWYIHGNLSVLWINIFFHHFKGACDEMSLIIFMFIAH